MVRVEHRHCYGVGSSPAVDDVYGSIRDSHVYDSIRDQDTFTQNYLLLTLLFI